MPPILKVIEGPDAGSTVRLTAGETIVGKGSRAALKLSSPAVSLEHFVVTQAGDSLFIENLSARGTQVNDTRIPGKTRLRLRDKIRVAEDTVIRLETEGGDSFVTQHRSLVILLIVLIVAGGIVLLAADPFGEPEQGANWERAHAALGRFIDTQVAANRYPQEMREYWDTAWRHESSQNYKASATVWLELTQMLAKAELPENVTGGDLKHQQEVDRSFARLLRSKTPDAVLDDPKVAGGLLVRFVNERYRFAYARSQRKGMFE